MVYVYIEDQTRRSLENIKAILAADGWPPFGVTIR